MAASQIAHERARRTVPDLDGAVVSGRHDEAFSELDRPDLEGDDRREEGGGEGVMARQLIDLEGKLSLKQIGERLLTRSVWPSTVPPH